MGLDIYFYKTPKADNLLEVGNELNKLRKEIAGKLTDEEYNRMKSIYLGIMGCVSVHRDYGELAYFRKAYLIQDYFEYTENCSHKILNREDVEHFLSLLEEWETLNANKKDYKREEYNKLVRAKFGLDDLVYFWYDSEPYEIENDMIISLICHIEEVLENTDAKKENIILYCWW